MIFTAQNVEQAGAPSMLYSAVSTDQVEWQVEGPLMGSSSTQFWYSALVDDRMVTIRYNQGDDRRWLAIVGVQMP